LFAGPDLPRGLGVSVQDGMATLIGRAVPALVTRAVERDAAGDRRARRAE
jgi:hypothetical protein